MSAKSVAVGVLLSLMPLSSFAHNNNSFKEFMMPANLIANIKFKNYAMGMLKLNQLHLDVAGVNVAEKTAEVIINDYDLKRLEAMGFHVEVVMTKSLMRGPDEGYKTPEEIEQSLKDFVAQYPELTELKEVGKSLQGRSIWAMKITSSEKSHQQKSAVLFNGMHHAREVMGPEVVLDIAETLLSKYGKDSKITHWVDNNEIWVMPMFNVDGNNMVWNGEPMWRKNVRGNYGVDINRNYPFAWGTCNGSSGQKWAQDYRGPSPASEPETNVMMNLVREIRPVFDISYHSYSELVIYPMGCKGKRTQNADVVEGLGQQMGKMLGYTAGTAWETLYTVDGSDIDWMYSEYQVIPYVIELNSSRDGFQPSYELRQPTVELNRQAWQMLLERMDGPGIRGIVTGKKLSDFTVQLERKGKTGQFESYMTYKGNSNGTFHAVVNPGEYRVTLTGTNMPSKIVRVGQSREDISIQL